jgi:hypothetical protein
MMSNSKISLCMISVSNSLNMQVYAKFGWRFLNRIEDYFFLLDVLVSVVLVLSGERSESKCSFVTNCCVHLLGDVKAATFVPLSKKSNKC